MLLINIETQKFKGTGKSRKNNENECSGHSAVIVEQHKKMVFHFLVTHATFVTTVEGKQLINKLH